MTVHEAMETGARLIGCAGWSIPKAAAGDFPEHGSHLERYAAVFPVVEINSSFYRPHRPQTYARWAGCVPDGFRFSVKLPKAITHEARLVGADALIEQFAREAGELGGKLGCVLVQLPPSLAFDHEAADAVFLRLRAMFSCTIACEGRHPSWFDDAATTLLREHGIIRVIADPPAGQPGPHVATANTVYMRLHGTPKVYYDAYPADFLDRLARQIAAWNAQGRDVWCIFDNTAAGSAVPNALDVLRTRNAHDSDEDVILTPW